MNVGQLRETVCAVPVQQYEDVDPCLEHILECPTCLGVIADLRLSTSVCEVRCPEYRAILEATQPQSQHERDHAVVLAS